MSPSLPLTLALPFESDAPAGLHSIATPGLWAVTIIGVAALILLDFLLTRRPHEVSFREALGWSAFYIALPLLFGLWVWAEHGGDTATRYYTGYVVEKSLSIDNLFVFILILSAFAVPRALQQRVLLVGVAGAIVLRGAFIAVGAGLIATFDWTFLLFGAILLVTAVKVYRDARSEDDETIEPGDLGIVRVMRRLMPVTDGYHGTRVTVKEGARRALTPLALVMAAIIVTDVIFAVDSVPAVFGITADPYLVFATNAFALLGLRALYFVLENALSKLVFLGYGLSVILGFIGVKLVLHWAHGVWPATPTVPTDVSLIVIVVVLAVTTVASLRHVKRHGSDEPARVSQ
ncbi:TerC/Alx family metal homeostasis membrane protein [Demequina capsici]|uniref:TerC/Alx family metal homeostasis membrane protein n=1 Tax=Demequina capsici TaxID=3075620 RepID=A0AA96F7C5_9MICO|nr:TerC/Alx family metal homeostasis membrane protein [Demequina sp. OYTSA14]WNM24634.1 TerC/Alx family metal homeostasis membrane protein [Demequina sp. OYTSA14]